MVAAGPLRDPDKNDWESEGMIIIRAESLEDWRMDPAHLAEAREVWGLAAWSGAIGDYSDTDQS